MLLSVNRQHGAGGMFSAPSCPFFNASVVRYPSSYTYPTTYKTRNLTALAGYTDGTSMFTERGDAETRRVCVVMAGMKDTMGRCLQSLSVAGKCDLLRRNQKS